MSTITPCYATASAGMHPSHILPLKLYAIAQAGFKFTEIAFPDLEAYAETLYETHGGPSGGEVRDFDEGGGKGGYRKIDEKGEGDVDKLISTAERVRDICKDVDVKVFSVMPFSEFEGYSSPEKRLVNLARARTWFKVLNALDCQLLQVGSSDDLSSSADYDIIAEDLRNLADEAAKCDPPIRIAYEMWAWGVHVNSWEHTWEICQKVNRNNFGLCLDTFQISAIYAAQLHLHTSPIPPLPSPILKSSLESLTETFSNPQNAKKIFYLQISDGALPPRSPGSGSQKQTEERVEQIHKEAKEEGDIHPLYAWSNFYRPLPFMDDLHAEEGVDGSEGFKYEGFLPVMDVIRSIVKSGWRGVWSYEVFYKPTQSRADPNIPKKWTEDAMRAHEKIMDLLRKEGSL